MLMGASLCVSSICCVTVGPSLLRRRKNISRFVFKPFCRHFFFSFTLQIGTLNGLFVLGRSIGFIGHHLDQKRLRAPLYRHPAGKCHRAYHDTNSRFFWSVLFYLLDDIFITLSEGTRVLGKMQWLDLLIIRGHFVVVFLFASRTLQ
jgi:hypothetical protein